MLRLWFCLCLELRLGASIEDDEPFFEGGEPLSKRPSMVIGFWIAICYMPQLVYVSYVHDCFSNGCK